MDEKLRLEVVTPYGSVFDGTVDEVTAPGSEGDFGVLPGHAFFVTTLRVGMLTLKDENGSNYMFISNGYAEVGPDRVVILADSAERASDIDIKRAKEAQERAEKWIKHEGDVDFARAESSLERAVWRASVVKESK